MLKTKSINNNQMYGVPIVKGLKVYHNDNSTTYVIVGGAKPDK